MRKYSGSRRVVIRLLPLLLLLSACGPPASALSWWPTDHTDTPTSNDGFTNWDFKPTADPQNNTIGYVDQPMDLVFRNDADIDYVAGFMTYCCSGSFQTMYIADHFGDVSPPYYYTNWIQVKGSKTSTSIMAEGDCDHHFRSYGAAPVHGRQFWQNYSPNWGYFIVATSHLDCDDESRFGYNEKSESLVYADALSKTAYVSTYNSAANSTHYDFKNAYTGYNGDSIHYIDNNGRGSFMWVF